MYFYLLRSNDAEEANARKRRALESRAKILAEMSKRQVDLLLWGKYQKARPVYSYSLNCFCLQNGLAFLNSYINI